MLCPHGSEGDFSLDVCAIQAFRDKALPAQFRLALSHNIDAPDDSTPPGDQLTGERRVRQLRREFQWPRLRLVWRRRRSDLPIPPRPALHDAARRQPLGARRLLPHHQTQPQDPQTKWAVFKPRLKLTAIRSAQRSIDSHHQHVTFFMEHSHAKSLFRCCLCTQRHMS